MLIRRHTLWQGVVESEPNRGRRFPGFWTL